MADDDWADAVLDDATYESVPGPAGLVRAVRNVLFFLEAAIAEGEIDAAALLPLQRRLAGSTDWPEIGPPQDVDDLGRYLGELAMAVRRAIRRPEPS